MKIYFRDSKLNYIPMIKTTIQDPLGNKEVEIELVVDTGFQGGILLPLHTYISLGLNLFEEPKIVGRTAIGNRIELRVSKALIKINNLKIMCSAYTTLGVRKALLGREVLKKTGLLYKPPDKLELGIDKNHKLGNTY
ncbi:MAG: clan AA aspartic protease [Desulfurococcales archaeon]|nr:clan AA aspartic protease [Desulfurococcales archaeon]